MAALQCDICGGKLMGRPGGIFECDSCGMQYDTAWAKEKIQEIKGTVKVEGTVAVQGTVKIAGPVEVKGGANPKSLLNYAKMALEDQDFETAEENFKKVLSIDPKSSEAYLGLSMVNACVCSLEGLIAEQDWNEKNFRRGRQFADRPLLDQINSLRQESLAVRKREEEERQQAETERRNRLKPLRERSRKAAALFDRGAAVLSDGRVTGADGTNSWRNMAAISKWHDHTVGLTDEGRVVATRPKTNYGQCDVENWENIVAVSTGEKHTAGLTADGRVLIASNEEKSCKEEVSTWRNIVDIAVGRYNTTVGLTAEGRLLSVNGTFYEDISEQKDIVAFSFSDHYFLGLTADGRVTGGWNSIYGNLSEVSNWENIVAVSAGEYHVVGLTAEGRVLATGNWDRDACDVASWENVVAVKAISGRTIGLTADGRILETGLYPLFPKDLRLFKNIDDLEQERADGQIALQKQEEQDRIAREEALRARARQEEEARQARIRQEKEMLQRREQYRERGLCQHCGRSFKGLFTKKCTFCGKPKDY